ncbi:MAG: EAL domain-containing protein [Persicimonas sp.]
MSGATIVLGYVITAILWVGGSHLALELWVAAEQQDAGRLVSSAGFVFITAAVLFYLIHSHQQSLGEWQSRLQDQERQLEGIVETIANGVLIVDLDGRITHVNQAFAEMFGFESSEIIGSRTDVLAVSGQPEHLQPESAFESVKKRGRWTAEALRRRSDGTSLLVRVSLAPVRNEAGDVVAYVGDYQDRRAIEEVREHVEGLGEVIESLSREMNLDKLGQKAVEAAVAVTGAELGGVALREGNDKIHYRWHIGFPDELVDQLEEPFDSDRGVVSRVLETESTELVEGYDDFDRALERYTDLGVKIVLSCPVIEAGRCVGALSLGKVDTEETFEERHISVTEAIARQIGVALQREQLFDHVAESERRFRQLVETVPDIVYLSEYPSFKTRYVSPAVETLLGYRAEECIEDPYLWWKQMEPSHRDRVKKEVFEQLEEGDEYIVEYQICHANGRDQVWFEDRGHLRRGRDGEPEVVAGVLVDITERKRAKERLEYVAYFDTMTGLPNRTRFLERLEESLADPTTTGGALFYVDVDRFHLVNDILGHEAGDELIVEVADRLRKFFDEDTILARPNADEFLVYIEHRGDGEAEREECLEAVEEIARDLLEEMKKPIYLANQESYITTSIGISMYPDDAEDADVLVRHAHRAVNRSKEMGRGGFCFYAGELATRQQRLLSLNTRLHRALEEDEFLVYYQPIVDLKSGAMVGVEALLRWQSPDDGLVAPGRFIPVAEETGLIVPIGNWVFDEVCRQLSQWRDEGISLYAAVNLSARQLWRGEIVKTVSGAIERHGVPAGDLEIEITESATMMDAEHIFEVMTEVHESGVSIAIDDFGTGYSSLERLKHMPVRTLKIDRSFVDGVPQNERNTNIVTTVVQLARNFNMNSLAEGIETADQWRFLHERGCPLGQGYFFSRPVPASDIEAMYRQNKRWSLEKSDEEPEDTAQKVIG